MPPPVGSCTSGTVNIAGARLCVLALLGIFPAVALLWSRWQSFITISVFRCSISHGPPKTFAFQLRVLLPH